MRQLLKFAHTIAPPKDRFSVAIKSTLDDLVQQNNADLTVGPILASAVILKISAHIHKVSGTAAIKTIGAPAGFTAGEIRLIPTAAWTLITGGNIGKASTAVVGNPITLVYDGTHYWPSY